MTDAGDSLRGVVEATMDMAVQEIPGPVAIYQSPVTLKSPVAGILCVVDVPGRRMGHNDVEAPVPP